jgi:hypothetical protein
MVDVASSASFDDSLCPSQSVGRDFCPCCAPATTPSPSLVVVQIEGVLWCCTHCSSSMRPLCSFRPKPFTHMQPIIEFSGSGEPDPGTVPYILRRLVEPQLLWVDISNPDTSDTHTAENGWQWKGVSAPNLNCGAGFTSDCGLWATGEPRSGTHTYLTCCQAQARI